MYSFILVLFLPFLFWPLPRDVTPQERTLKPPNAIKVPTFRIKNLRGRGEKEKINHFETQDLISPRFHAIWSHPLDIQLGPGRVSFPSQTPFQTRSAPRGTCCLDLGLAPPGSCPAPGPLGPCPGPLGQEAGCAS